MGRLWCERSITTQLGPIAMTTKASPPFYGPVFGTKRCSCSWECVKDLIEDRPTFLSRHAGLFF